MAFCRSVFVLSVICVLQSVSSSQVPVFFWGDLGTTAVQSNPLAKVPLNEFNVVLKHQLQDNPFAVVFIEETLSPDDFSFKNVYGETSFPYLESNMGKAVYLPSVDSALRALNKLADPEKVDHVKLTENGLSAEIQPDSGRFLFINLKDAREGESRTELLRRHNDFMQDLFSKLKKEYPKVVAVYTAHYPSWTVTEHSRVRRQTEAEVNGMYNLTGLLLQVNSLVLKEGNRTVTLTGSSGQSIKSKDAQLEATLSFGDIELALYFYRYAGYWFFNEVALIENKQGTSNVTTMLPIQEVSSLEGFSYHCSQSLTFASINTTTAYSLTFSDLQIEAFTAENQTSFSEALDCVGFFSAPIWAGLFVVFILLAITFYGIMMMMDIKTMDQFDDPKGKTITINASE